MNYQSISRVKHVLTVINENLKRGRGRGSPAIKKATCDLGNTNSHHVKLGALAIYLITGNFRDTKVLRFAFALCAKSLCSENREPLIYWSL